MKFLNPWGLLLLLGVPVLIIIYIIKAQHEDRQVSSTFIWKLSDRFMKKRLPLQKFRKILLFILQLLAVILSAVLVSRPAIVNPSSKDYILVVDTSASMMVKDGEGVSRIDRVKEMIDELSEETENGHRISLIVASDEPYTALKCSSSANEVKLAAKNLSATYGTSDTEAALRLVDEISAGCAEPEVYFYTDRDCESGNEGERFTLYNMSVPEKEWNLSVNRFESRKADGKVVFTGSVVCKGKSVGITAGLKINGKTVDAKELACYDGVETPVTFTPDIKTFDTAELFVDVRDSFEADNSSALCRFIDRQRSVLIVSASPFYLNKTFSAFENCNVTVVGKIDETPFGYDLYVFDGDTGISPDMLPDDGSIIFFAPEDLPSGAAYGEDFEKTSYLTFPDAADVAYTGNADFSEAAVGTYKELSVSAAWQPLLQADGTLVGAYRVLSDGLVRTVFSFDLHDTNLPLVKDYMTFMRNLVYRMSPPMIEKNDYVFGEEVIIHTSQRSEAPVVVLPDETLRYPRVDGGRAIYSPQDIGIYTVFQADENGDGVYADFYVHVDANEIAGEDLTELHEVLTNGEEEEETREATFEIALWIMIAFLILLLAEWGVYYYEQY